jgi:hypothetical protein
MGDEQRRDTPRNRRWLYIIIAGLIVACLAAVAAAGLPQGRRVISLLNDQVFNPVDQNGNPVRGDFTCGMSCDLEVGVGCGTELFCVNNICVNGSGTCDGGQPVGNGTCGQFCNPDASNCDSGLECVREPDGYFVCWFGTDREGEFCDIYGPTPTPGGTCGSPCEDSSECAALGANAECRSGLCYSRSWCGPVVCGDSYCDVARGEDPSTCLVDCGAGAAGVCGDGYCDVAHGEDPDTCPADCGTGASGGIYCGSPCASDSQCAIPGENWACSPGGCYAEARCGGGTDGSTDQGSNDSGDQCQLTQKECESQGYCGVDPDKCVCEVCG